MTQFKVGDKVRMVSIGNTDEFFGHTDYMLVPGDVGCISRVYNNDEIMFNDEFFYHSDDFVLDSSEDDMKAYLLFADEGDNSPQVWLRKGDSVKLLDADPEEAEDWDYTSTRWDEAGLIVTEIPLGILSALDTEWPDPKPQIEEPADGSVVIFREGSSDDFKAARRSDAFHLAEEEGRRWLTTFSGADGAMTWEHLVGLSRDIQLVVAGGSAPILPRKLS